MHKPKLFIRVILLLLLSGGAQAKFDATIPVIDMNDYYSNKRQRFIDGLANALHTVGFVAVINSRVDKQILDEAYEQSKLFYAQPVEYKMQYHDPKLNGQRGYVQSEMAKGKDKKDHKEFYHIARDYPEEILKEFKYPANIWPNNQKFKLAMQNLTNELGKYTQIIEEALAASIGRKPNFFTKMTEHGSFLLRSIHYPANPPKDTLWAAEHTDIDLFTILPRATAQGLQVLNQDNKWVDVVVPDNAFIINAGDMLQNLTNGYYKSAKHRVASKGKDNLERYSMVAFIHTRPNDRMDPLPEFIKKAGIRKFANATSIELLSERLIDLGLSSPELLENFAKSGAPERLIEVNRASPRVLQALKNANIASNTVLIELNRIEKS